MTIYKLSIKKINKHTIRSIVSDYNVSELVAEEFYMTNGLAEARKNDIYNSTANLTPLIGFIPEIEVNISIVEVKES